MTIIGRVEDWDSVYGGQDSRTKMETIVRRPLTNSKASDRIESKEKKTMTTIISDKEKLSRREIRKERKHQVFLRKGDPLPDELKERAKCEKSPTGVHHFILKAEGGVVDGPCRYCRELYSKVHPQVPTSYYISQIQGGVAMAKNAKETKVAKKQAAEPKTIGVSELATMAGTTPVALRKLLRKDFSASHERGRTYTWEEGDPAIQMILKAVKAKQDEANAPVESVEPVEPVKEVKTHATKTVKGVPTGSMDDLARLDANLFTYPEIEIEGC